MYDEKVFFGIITLNLTDVVPIIDFLENARSFGHPVSTLIVCYLISCDAAVVQTLRTYTEVVLIKRDNPVMLRRLLKKRGLKSQQIQELLQTPHAEEFHRVSYGSSRNMVLLAALLLDADFLFFFDTDTFPKILTHFDYTTKKAEFIDIDFVGSHLQYLTASNDIVVTTSDYTGYYIIPRMQFPNLRDLLIGIQKEDRYNYITTNSTPVTRDYYLKDIFNTQKILGGNMAINLRKPSYLSPFYSQTMILDGECYLGRGEDTLFGPLIQCAGGRCVDIDLKIFHNCFGDFPAFPDITIQKNRDRFFFACMGWIIRNPFFNWFHSSKLQDKPTSDPYSRRIPLMRGSLAAAEYLNDPRFLLLPEAFSKANELLPQWVAQYQRLMDVWYSLQLKLEDKR